MNQEINELEINGVKYVRKDSIQQPETLSLDNAVIVRSETAGCFFGYLVECELAKGIVKLKQARRLWYWSGAASLSQLSVDGTSKPKDCKFPTPVASILIAKVVEVIPCTIKAVNSLNEVPIWKQ